MAFWFSSIFYNLSPSIPKLVKGHVTLEIECLDRLYLNGYIAGLVRPGGMGAFLRVQLGKPIASPVVLGQITEAFQKAVKTKAEESDIPLYEFQPKEHKDDVANQIRRKRGVRDEIVFIGGGAGPGVPAVTASVDPAGPKSRFTTISKYFSTLFPIDPEPLTSHPLKPDPLSRTDPPAIS
jgi:hypothetical protein